jgi:hypothetical protein
MVKGCHRRRVVRRMERFAHWGNVLLRVAPGGEVWTRGRVVSVMVALSRPGVGLGDWRRAGWRGALNCDVLVKTTGAGRESAAALRGTP